MSRPYGRGVAKLVEQLEAKGLVIRDVIEGPQFAVVYAFDPETQHLEEFRVDRWYRAKRRGPSKVGEQQ
jgi:hypothetical protein